MGEPGSRSRLAFLVFSAVFAALVAFVFWGTWSPDFSPVMPDDGTTHPLAYSEVAANYLREVLKTGKVAPADLLWSGLFVSPYFCQELKYALGLFFAALGLVYFLRGRGLSHLASYGAALLLSFCGYWITLFSAGHGGWFVWMTYGLFAFGLADRAVRKGKLKNWLLLGAVVSWASFRQQDLWLLFTVLTAAYFAWCCVRERTFPWKGLLIAGAAFLLIGLPNFKDTLQNTVKGRIEQINENQTLTGTSATEAEKRWEFVTNWSLPPEDTLEFLVPRVHGDTSCPFVLSLATRYGRDVRSYTGALGRPLNAPQGNYRQHSLYVGWALCLLAVSGLVFFVRTRGGDGPRRVLTRDVLFFLVAGLVCYLLSLGRYFAPAYRVVFALPFGDLIRCPVKWHHLTELCLAVLAGYGIEGLLSLKPFSGSRARAALGAVILLGAVDLAVQAHRFCLPVDLTEARRQDCGQSLTFLRRADFGNPQVAAMVKAKRIVPLAQPNPETYLVGVLQPRERNTEPMPPLGLPFALGVLSVLASLAVVVLALNPRGRFDLVVRN